MQHIALIPWLDPETIIAAAGPWALLVVCFIVFAETGLLIGFLLPGDTLLVISGLLSHSTAAAPNGVFGISVWWVALLIGIAAFIGGEVGYLIGYKGGPTVFERKESGVFSVKNVERTNEFFVKYGGLTVIVARFVPIVRTFAPVAAGVGKMHKGRYTLYNLVGAVLWGFGLTMLGYAIGFIPVVGELVAEYIDLILLAAVGGTLIVTLWHYFRERSKARKEEAAGEDVVTDAEEARHLVLDPEVFDRGPEHHDGHHDGRHRGHDDGHHPDGTPPAPER
ncbi:DedA family protein [Microbacterium sp. F51-2R]|uniref:DedA family protein n=1 Tax=Microbacterium sp. F51-2R TaxID=3445777 RepID=UPI003F9F2744